eukprot:g5796.t1
MSTSGGPSTAAVKADQLRNLAKLVEESRPWYEALGMTAEKASGILGEDAKDYVSEQGSGLGRKTAELLLSAADVDALKPVCIVFKALFDALKGAAKNRNDLIHLIHYGVLLVKSIPDTGTASGLSPPVKNALREFGAEVESVMQRARSFGVTQQPAAHGRLRRCLCRVRNVANHAEINEAIQHHVTNFDRIVAALGAGAAVQSAQNTEEMKARLPPRLRPKLAPVPPGLPAGEAWHAVRDHVEDEVYKILSGDEPAVAALTGRSGAGKSTAAADMVRNRKVDIRGLDDETEDQARTRMDRLERMRARFSDGVVYLRVGKGEGAADRLPDLMRKLAKALHEDVMKKIVGAPKAGEKGESYVKKMLTQKKKRCLVVADDVWEPQVIAKLKETGMFVLLTTRFPEIVEPDEVVDVDQLTPAEAEDVLRGAAELPPGQRLCDAAMEVLDDICGFVAMDIAFVGSWSTLRTADSGAWAEIVSEINDKIDDVRQGADGMDDRQVKRLAVVRTGFEYLGKEEGTLAQKLYVAIAVLPDAGRLEKAEEWFQKALRVEEDGGRAASSQALSTLHALGRCAREAGRHKKAKEFYRRALEIKEEKLGANLQVAYSLYRMGGCAWEAGQLQEAEALFKQLLQKEEDELGPDHVAVAETLQYLGRCALEAERLEKAKELFQRALEIQKAKLGPNDVAVAVTLQHMGRCVRRAGLPGEAEELLRRALEIQVANLGLDDLQVAYTLHELGLCVGRLGGYEGEEEALFQRALKIKEANLGRDDVEVASTLGEMGRCVRRAGRVEDAGTLFQRALEITKAKLEPNDVAVATLEEEMRWCRDMKTGDKLDEWEEASEGSVY